MKPVEIEFLLRDRTEEGLDKMSGNLDGVQAKYNSTRATVAALQKEVEKLQGKKLSSGIDSSVNTAQIDTLKKKITELRAEVAALEKEYPELGKTVSGIPLVPPDAQKVKSTYNGLHNSIQQIAREMPALAMGPQTFFLAISNNLPIFTDELARAKKEYNELVQSGKKGVPVWKQILSSLFSWQTALTTGIMLLVMYGDEIVRWISDLFKGKKAIDSVTDAIGSMHEAIDAENLAGQIANFEKLARAYRAIGDNAEEKQKFLKDYKDEIEKTGVVISDIYDADNLFIDNADRFVESIQKRALALAGMELAKEQYRNSLKQIEENENHIQELEQKLKETNLRKDKMTIQIQQAQKEQLKMENQVIGARQRVKEMSEKALINSAVYRDFHHVGHSPHSESWSTKTKITENDWKELIAKVDETYDSFTLRLTEFYPSITEQELRVSILLKIGIKPTGIGEIIAKSKQNITSIRKKLYKHTHNEEGGSEDWDNFIRQF